MPVTEIAPLATVKQFLRIPNPTQPNGDDVVIQVLMDAATAAIETETGHVVQKDVSAERHDGGHSKIWLRELPVLYVRSVQEGWGYYNYELDDQQVNTVPALSIWAYSLDDRETGELSRRAAGNVLYPFVSGSANVRVDYVVGRQEVPADIQLAFMTLVSFWYRQTQLRLANNGGADAVQFNALDETASRTSIEASINFGVPMTILEMLKDHRRMPVIG